MKVKKHLKRVNSSRERLRTWDGSDTEKLS